MTDKDPKDMTVSELLRLADSHLCSMCHLVMAGDESCATTGCASWAYRLADKIDAELAQARELSLRAGAELWAKANGWPDFKQGEDFGAWLDRCFIPRPRFEDGEPVQIGDSPVGLDGVEKFIFTRSCGGSCQMQDANGNMLTVFPGERVKRPAPEVLGADGKPVKVGETVWSTVSGHEGTVSSLNDDSTAYVEWDDERWSPCIDCCNLTHTPPDTQERIDEDARKDQFEYWQCLEYECCGCPIEIEGMNPKKRYECNDCCSAMALDLLRRQRELDARKGGAE